MKLLLAICFSQSQQWHFLKCAKICIAKTCTSWQDVQLDLNCFWRAQWNSFGLQLGSGNLIYMCLQYTIRGEWTFSVFCSTCGFVIIRNFHNLRSYNFHPFSCNLAMQVSRLKWQSIVLYLLKLIFSCISPVHCKMNSV